MRRLSLIVSVSGLLLATVFGLFQVAGGQEDAPGEQTVTRQERDGSNVREVRAPAGTEGTAALSLIDSPTPFCFQPDPAQDQCFINWASISVSASPDSMRAMTVTIDSVGTVSRYQGYFQEAITITHGMHGRGFQVACGSPGAGDKPQLGNGYSWTIEAADNSGATTSNFGTLYCPPFTP